MKIFEYSDELVLTRADLLKLGQIIKAFSESLPDPEMFIYDGPVKPVVVDCRVHTGDGAWWTDPRHFQIQQSKVVFRNESGVFEIKLDFTSGLVSPSSLIIEPLKTGTILVDKGQEKNTTSFSRRKPGAVDWEGPLERTGNGASMGINNP